MKNPRLALKEGPEPYLERSQRHEWGRKCHAASQQNTRKHLSNRKANIKLFKCIYTRQSLF